MTRPESKAEVENKVNKYSTKDIDKMVFTEKDFTVEIAQNHQNDKCMAAGRKTFLSSDCIMKHTSLQRN